MINNRYITIKKLVKIFESKKILLSINSRDQLSDEPKASSYTVYIKTLSKYSDGVVNEISGHGFSYASKIDAMFRCCVEAAERFSQCSFHKKDLLFTCANDISKPKIDLSPYDSSPQISKKVFGWTNCFDLNNTEFFIPAQLVYLNYNREWDESLLLDANSTGTAAATDNQTALLKGIYENIERDSFMNFFLTKYPPKRLDPTTLHDVQINRILKYLDRYKLEVYVFDITTDLGIPTIMSCVVDRTGMGPCITFGTKASFDLQSAIISSIGEAAQIRNWLRVLLIESKGIIKINPKTITSFADRGGYWAPIQMLQHFSYLLNIKTSPITPSPIPGTTQELEMIKQTFQNKNYQIFYKDVSSPLFKDLSLKVYRTVTPQLQPLPLNEANKKPNLSRLKDFCRYFGISKYRLNTQPQPFL